MSSLVLSTFLALGAVSTASAQSMTPVRFSLSFSVDGSGAPYIHARHTGMFKDAGIDVTIDRGAGSGAVLTRVASGTYDFGIADVSSIIEFASKNPDAAPVAVMVVQDRMQLVLVSFKTSGVTKPTDLAGKSLGGARGEATMSLFPAFAKTVSLDPAKVEIKYAEVRLREALFLRKEYEVVAGFDASIWFNVKPQGVKFADLNFMYYSDHGFDFYGQAIIVSQAFMNRDPAAVSKVVAVLTEAWRKGIKNPKASAASLPSADSTVDVALETERLEWIVGKHVATDRVKRIGLSTVDPARLQKQIDTVAAAYELPMKPDAAKIYTAKFLPPESARKLQ
jgi:NitT/TauT family transport system substrate-binding protein